MAPQNKTRNHGTMTESQFLAWIRSTLRSKWLRWIPRAEALKSARRAYKGPKKNQKYEYQCSICKQWKSLKECQVDHHPIEAGSILSVDDIGEFCNNLYCELDNLRCVCTDCHKSHTLASRKGITFEEAQQERLITEFIKSKTAKQLLAYLQSKGYNTKDLSNSSKRRVAVEELFRKGEIDVQTS